jgi:muconolactone delta-isomerase
VEFLVSILISPPEGVDAQEVAARTKEEGARAAELASQGTIRRLWRPVDGQGLWRNIGLWSAGTETELRAAIASLPLSPWMTIEVTGLSEHPSDPLRAGLEQPSAGASRS